MTKEETSKLRVHSEAVHKLGEAIQKVVMDWKNQGNEVDFTYNIGHDANGWPTFSYNLDIADELIAQDSK